MSSVNLFAPCNLICRGSPITYHHHSSLITVTLSCDSVIRVIAHHRHIGSLVAAQSRLCQRRG